MSTRANIIIKDNYDKLFFYRHSDGYPECTKTSLEEFMKLYSNKLRDNVSQSAGWLILHGALEYSYENVKLTDLLNDDKIFTSSLNLIIEIFLFPFMSFIKLLAWIMIFLKNFFEILLLESIQRII